MLIFPLSWAPSVAPNDPIFTIPLDLLPAPLPKIRFPPKVLCTDPIWVFISALFSVGERPAIIDNPYDDVVAEPVVKLILPLVFPTLPLAIVSPLPISIFCDEVPVEIAIRPPREFPLLPARNSIFPPVVSVLYPPLTINPAF